MPAQQDRGRRGSRHVVAGVGGAGTLAQRLRGGGGAGGTQYSDRVWLEAAANPISPCCDNLRNLVIKGILSAAEPCSKP